MYIISVMIFTFSIWDFGHPQFLKSQFGPPVMKSPRCPNTLTSTLSYDIVLHAGIIANTEFHSAPGIPYVMSRHKWNPLKPIWQHICFMNSPSITHPVLNLRHLSLLITHISCSLCRLNTLVKRLFSGALVGCWVLWDTGYMIRGAYCYSGYGVAR